MFKNSQSHFWEIAAKISLVLAYLTFASHMHAANKTRPIANIEVDQGSVTLILDESVRAYKVEATVDAKCSQTQVKMRDVGSKPKKVKVEHVGGPCHTGANIVLFLNPNVDLNLSLGAGVIDFSDLKQDTKSIKLIGIDVKIGSLESSLPGFNADRSLLGSHGTYQGRGSSSYSAKIVTGYAIL